MKNLNDADYQQPLKNSKKVYKGTRFDVHALEVQAKSGKSVKKEFISHPGAVVILPLLEDQVVMIKNERFSVGKTLWELPAGTIELDEPHDKTAYRELIEETGYEAEKISPLLSYYVGPGICNEIMYVYVAEGLKEVGQSLDDSEKITVETVPWNKILEMIQNGEICDSKTLLTLLYYRNRLAL